MIKERLIDPLKPVARCLGRNRIAEMREPQARPRPIHGMLNESRSDGIAKNIPDRRQEMAVLLNWKTFEPALPYMPVTPIVLVIPTHVTGHPPLHEGAEGRFGGWLHDHMKMIWHEAGAEDLHRKLGFGSG